MTDTAKKPSLTLKWGTIKGWNNCLDGTPFRAAFEEFAAIDGMSMSAMQQGRTDAHKLALCKMIDAVSDAGGEVWNDWDGVIMDRDQAKEYVMEYGK